VDERRGVDEFDDRGVEHRAVAFGPTETRRHQQNRRSDPLAAAVLDVPPHFRNQGDSGLDVADEFLLDRLQILADGFEDLRQLARDGRFLRCISQWEWPRAGGRLTILKSGAECQRA
jgi:hypothetical protein